MMFQTKTTKMIRYLDEKLACGELSAFDALVQDYLSGILKKRLIESDLVKIEIHIDWRLDYKCVNIQSKYGAYFVDVQVDPAEFSIAYDKDEPDDPIDYTLESVEQFYSTLEKTLKSLS